MAQLRFDWDWVDAPGVDGPELAATWSRLRIEAGSSVVTLVLDERAKTVREHVYVPLYPMAEWLASNWWFLAAEQESEFKQGADLTRRHSLAANREGYAYPDLHVFPRGTQTRLVWHRQASPRARIRFLDGGEALADSAGFRETCGDLLDSVVARLVSLGIEDSLLQQEWMAVRAADAEEEDFCRTAAGLGWDPYAIDDARRGEVLALAERFGALLAEAVPALNAPHTTAGWTVIERALRDARRRNTLNLERIWSVRDRFSSRDSSASHPWRAGQELARALREELGLNGEPVPTMEALGLALDEAAIDAATTRVAVDGGDAILVDGLVTCGEGDRPAFAFRQRGEQGRRFHFCRALAEVLWRPGADALLTQIRTERQQSNRAFAAEFLAPSAGLRHRVRRARLNEDDIDELAKEFGVSPMVIGHQLDNHRLGGLQGGWPRTA